jgi:hypothetical protein
MVEENTKREDNEDESHVSEIEIVDGRMLRVDSPEGLVDLLKVGLVQEIDMTGIR